MRRLTTTLTILDLQTLHLQVEDPATSLKASEALDLDAGVDGDHEIDLKVVLDCRERLKNRLATEARRMRDDLAQLIDDLNPLENPEGMDS